MTHAARHHTQHLCPPAAHACHALLQLSCMQGFGASSSSSTSSTRFSMELPLPSDSSADVVQLTADVLAKLPAAAAKDACIVFASEQAAAAAAGALKRSSSVLSLRDACRADSLSGPLLLVAPTVADVSGPKHDLSAFKVAATCAN